VTKVIFLNDARADLKAIFKYTFRRYGLKQAEKYQTDLKRSAQTAAQFPYLGRRYTTRNGKLFMRYNSGRHVIFYVDTESGGITVVRILHDAMNFDDYLD
jgi:toxin ParE1/3/4